LYIYCAFGGYKRVFFVGVLAVLFNYNETLFTFLYIFRKLSKMRGIFFEGVPLVFHFWRRDNCANSYTSI